MTNPTQATDNLKSITGLSNEEYDALSAALAKMRAPKTEDVNVQVHVKMLSAVRNQLQQRLNSTTNLSDEEKAKILRDIADLDRKVNSPSQ